MIYIDGSNLEGGGQIVRTALGLSVLTQQGFNVDNIRSGRTQSGLKMQHLTAVKALRKICSAQTNEIEVGSTELRFVPGKIQVSELEIDIKTAGSITLLLQAIMMPLCFNKGPVKLTIKGGTDVIFSPSIDYLKFVLLPHLQRYVKSIDLLTKQRGYFPKGGGEIELIIKPKIKLKDFKSFNEFRKAVFDQVEHFDLEGGGKLIKIRGVSHASRDLAEREVAERQANSAKAILKELGVPVIIQSEYNKSLSTGCGITLWAVFSVNEDIDTEHPILLGSCEIGEKGISAEDIGIKCAKKLMEEINRGAAVDSHLADQLIPWLIFGGVIDTGGLTSHAKTNLWTVNNFVEPPLKEKGSLVYFKNFEELQD